MAARDRFGGYGEPAQTPLQRYIIQACDPQNFEPNLALNLEIADLINAKKGNAPREAAVAIVNFVNHRNPNVALLALNLLDICVKNCGYPFHLQISTKEFLNELVRRFPERPPMHSSRPQNKILELIEEWRCTICETSRYKEDLGFIRDMHRLLRYKGYQFPAVRREDAAVLNPSDNLRSAEEMEQEERAAQAAKLQELIRRGGPHDLQEANKLMKVMAGYDLRNKTDYRAKAAEEVGKVQQKAKLLEDMLQKHKVGDKVAEGDVFEELANALMSAQPKIQKMCEEESEDHEAVAKLLEINDSIHRTVERYRLIKKGDLEGANRIPKGTLGTSGAGVSTGPNNELSLIDLGGPDDDLSSAPVPSTQRTAAPQSSLENDLLGLSMGESSGQDGAISLGSSNGTGYSGFGQTSTHQHLSNAQITSMFQQPATQPAYNAFSALASPPPQASTSRPQSAQPAALKPDPFAALTSHAPRQASPFQFQQSISPPVQTSSPLGRGNFSAPPPAPTAAPAAAPVTAPTAAADDEWTFASALPDALPELTVTNSALNVVWAVSRPPDAPDVIEIKSRVSNNTALPVSDVVIQVAVTKSYQLRLEPQSARGLAPKQVNGITQTIQLHGVQRGSGGAVRMRWKASYVVGSERREEMGEVSNLGIA
ncbi:VHS-domain-containing protein [Trichodelitschia bisporula]|uniref:VHS-domain-containing protein n=1 Tax=Trichodelitschia bisporula TaxID=703511 RepID=A0A6G1HV39_9PEZI|nr:VHS-domain-containing protein [Trichodelitschia bisporula]